MVNTRKNDSPIEGHNNEVEREASIGLDREIEVGNDQVNGHNVPHQTSGYEVG